MPRRNEEIEVVDIDDPPPVTDLIDKTKKREMRVRKSTGLGGKTRRVAISARPVRRPPPPSTRSEKTVQCFDIDDGDDHDDESGADQDSDSDDDIEVLEDEDPLEDGESIEEDQTAGFCDLCGLHLVGVNEMEKHQHDVHKLTTCKWCQTRTQTSELKKHLLTSCAKFVKLRGTHCSLHNRMETEEDLNHQQYRNCRALSCDTCEQRFEITSLNKKEAGKELFVCPGCLHGRIDPSRKINTEVSEASDGKQANNKDEEITEDSEITEITVDNEITETTIDNEITETTVDNEITETTVDNEITEITKVNEVMSLMEDHEVKEITGDSEISESQEIIGNNDDREITGDMLESVVRSEDHTMKIFEVEEEDTANVLVSEILAEVVTNIFLTETSPSSSLIFSDESFSTLDDPENEDISKGSALVKELEGPKCRERRVARKSSRAPLNPQRAEAGAGPETGLSQEELLLLELPQPPTPTIKRKPEQCELNQKPVRKVARKSTKPPANPQREKEPELVELEDEDEDEDIVEILGGFTATSLLLKSPPPDHRGNEALQELEEMILG